MRFDLTQPCKDCPFLKGSSTNRTLSEGRLDEIINDIRSGMTFTCHKTLELKHNEQQHCAGALIFLEREDRPNQMMRIAERLRRYDRTKLKMDVNLVEAKDIQRPICVACEGRGKIPITYSAMYWPDRFPDDLIDCPRCCPSGQMKGPLPDEGLPRRYR